MARRVTLSRDAPAVNGGAVEPRGPFFTTVRAAVYAAIARRGVATGGCHASGRSSSMRDAETLAHH